MAVILKADPSASFADRQDFLNRVNPHSIAVDGIIKGEQTFRVPEGPYANFDHHYGSDDIATRSSFMQLYLEIKQGGFVERFSRNGKLCVKMYADHGDEDVNGCYWALKNAERIIKNENGRIREFVDLCDKLDTTAGSFDSGDTALRRRMAWMFKPYHDARYKNRLAGMDAKKLNRMIRTIEGRINEYVDGKGGEIELKGGYDIIGNDNDRNRENGWVFTREHNPASRMMMYLDGINTFVSLVGTKRGGWYQYVYGKKTDWDINLDFTQICDTLNKNEGDTINKDNCWGGTRIRGGSPKLTWSKLKPRDVESIVNESIEEMKSEKNT